MQQIQCSLISAAYAGYNWRNYSGRQAEGFQGLGFLPDEDSSLLEPTVVETEKVLNGVIRAFRDPLQSSHFSLQPEHLSSYQLAMQSLNTQIVPSPIFFADAMLGRLARWLRMLGHDTAYEKVIADESLISRVVTEQRWLLTRDRYLVQRKVLRCRHTLIVSDHLQDQLQQLRSELHLDLDLSDKTASRCADCNVLLRQIPHEEAARSVPSYVASQQGTFAQCPRCERIYWPGTHWIRMGALLKELMAS